MLRRECTTGTVSPASAASSPAHPPAALTTYCARMRRSPAVIVQVSSARTSVTRCRNRTCAPADRARGERRDLLRRREIEDVDGNAVPLLEVDSGELPFPRGVRDEEEVATGPIADVDAVLLGEGAVRPDAAPGQFDVQRIGPLRP